MIQLAWRFLVFQKDSALTQWFRARTDNARGMHSVAGCMLEAIQAWALDLPDLIAHEPSALHVAM
jgi:hypothetical protein